MNEHPPAVKTTQEVAASLFLRLSTAHKPAHKGRLPGRKVAGGFGGRRWGGGWRRDRIFLLKVSR